MAKETSEKIVQLIKQYDFETAHKRANEFRALCDNAARSTALTEPEATAIEQARALLDRWFVTSAPSVDDWLQEWKTLTAGTGAALPKSVAAALFGKIPPAGFSKVSWNDELLGSRDASYCSLVVANKLQRTADLIALAKVEPRRFYLSAALDALLAARVAPPRIVWDTLHETAERSAGLLPGPEALAEAFSRDGASDSFSWLAGLLQPSVELRRSVALQIMRDPRAIQMFVKGVSNKISKKGEGASADAIRALSGDVLAVAMRLVSEKRPMAKHARWMINQVLIDSTHPDARPQSAVIQQFVDASDSLSKGELGRALRAVDQGKSAASNFLLTSPQAVHAEVREYLETLPAGHEVGFSDPAARFQRYAGRRESTSCASARRPRSTSCHTSTKPRSRTWATPGETAASTTPRAR